MVLYILVFKTFIRKRNYSIISIIMHRAAINHSKVFNFFMGGTCYKNKYFILNLKSMYIYKIHCTLS